MKRVSLSVAYMPLVDAAPLIAASELGFAETEGLALDLIPAPSWSSVRDMLAFGRVDAAHLLSPIPIAMALGLGGVTTPVSAVSVMSVNGNVIGVGRALESRLRAGGHAFGFDNATAAAADLAVAAKDGFTVGVPFPFSMHVELLQYWFKATALANLPVTIRTVPPPLMADALASGEIDAFCVGEPWGSVAVENGVGALLLPGNAIWAFAPEKVLAVRTDWADTEPHLLGRLMRAVWKAGQWLAHPESHTTVAEIMSRKSYLDVSPELIDRSLSGQMVVSASGDQRAVPGYLHFGLGVASFPWRSQAKWIAAGLAHRHGLDAAASSAIAAGIFRSDLYRRELAPVGADLPSASEKVEGAIRDHSAVASAAGRVLLQPDSFFDGRIFDPLP
jgi:ABC-type nitrate/sulfonate/bicarbonate transport system substrate-binding protein